jgi:hypothetical protein
MAKTLMVSIEATVNLGSSSEFYYECAGYALRLEALLGSGVTLHIYKEGMVHLMASFQFRGWDLGQLAFIKGQTMAPADAGKFWGGPLMHVTPENVWREFFRPHFKERVTEECRRLAELERMTRTRDLPSLAEAMKRDGVV